MNINSLLFLRNQLLYVKASHNLIETLYKITGEKFGAKLIYDIPMIHYHSTNTSIFPTTLAPVEAFHDLLAKRIYYDPFKHEHWIQMQMIKNEFVYISITDCVDEVYEIEEDLSSLTLKTTLVYKYNSLEFNPSSYLLNIM